MSLYINVIVFWFVAVKVAQLLNLNKLYLQLNGMGPFLFSRLSRQ